ncbi:molybdopterin-dependent oxidoreductase [Streptomyces thermolineatus]|uniref:molybdopterin-dependent oxidoreductase n=1 Tax=Streptomyces thermolineatus TaxID=44033 RepID=UPI003CD05317
MHPALPARLSVRPAHPGRRGWRAAAVLSGLLAGFGALSAAELVAAAVRPEAGPVTAVGGAVVDAAPLPLKDFAVRTFGTYDKPVLLGGILLLLACLAALLGLLAPRRGRAAATGVLLLGLVGALTAAARPGGGPWDAAPSAVGAVVGAALLRHLAGLLRGPYQGRKAPETRAPASDPAPLPDRTPRPNPDPASEPAPAPDSAPTRTPVPGSAGAPEAPGAPETPEAPGAPEPPGADGFDRRRFVLTAGAAAAVSAVAGVAGRRLGAGRGAGAAAARGALTLPAPDSPAPRLPRGTDLKIPGLSPFTTPGKDFYRVDTALVVPRVDVRTWRLRLHGRGVREEREFTYRDLTERRTAERDITLTCVSNQVGGPYVGHARWTGVELAALLREAGVRPPSEGGPADQLVARSVDGMTIGTPVETVLDGRDALLALGMNGEPLPFEHGFPVRMVVPGLYGYVSACKWIVELELTSFDDFDAYWVRRGWAREAPVKTQSRIDTPKPFASVAAGRVVVAGVAWAQHRGVGRVEVRVDGGRWRPAELAAEAGADTWRQWSWEWDARPGSHRLEVRAADRTGRTQTGERVGTVPDGATGWHSVVVSVT